MTDLELYMATDGLNTFKFGDSEKLCAQLLELVVLGKKTATCSSLRAYDSGEDALPVVGQKDVALNWDGTPALILETTNVTMTRFCDVEASFALAEGENEDLDGWRDDHQAYFERNGGFDPEMMLVCERFRIIRTLTVKGKD